jgi:rubredoxin
MAAFRIGYGARGRLLTAIACCAATIGVVLAVVGAYRSIAGPPGQRMHLSCEACGHQWDEPAGPSHPCPKCGNPGAVKAYFKCPRCGEVFCGLEMIKDGVGRYRYREVGVKPWSATRPSPPACPKCKVASPDIYERGISGQAVGLPPTDGAGTVSEGN